MATVKVRFIERAARVGSGQNLSINGTTQMQSTPSGPQDKTRAFILKILKDNNWTANKLASEANVSKGTISRALNDPRFVTSMTTIDKIARAANIQGPAPDAKPANSPGMREPEAVYLAAPADLPEQLTPDNTQAVWRLASRAAELAGYMPGDYLLVDSAAVPVAGDLVCVQIVDQGSGSAETVFRIYDPPYAVVRTMDAAISQKPQIVDQDRVSIWGAVVKSLRIRKGA
jgi:transcriptional regulator with XRE-family HTH domain